MYAYVVDVRPVSEYVVADVAPPAFHHETLPIPCHTQHCPPAVQERSIVVMDVAVPEKVRRNRRSGGIRVGSRRHRCRSSGFHSLASSAVTLIPIGRTTVKPVSLYVVPVGVLPRSIVRTTRASTAIHLVPGHGECCSSTRP